MFNVIEFSGVLKVLLRRDVLFHLWNEYTNVENTFVFITHLRKFKPDNVNKFRNTV